jgi:D-sedoheptulose 7-phosphate isomerase
MGFTSAYLQETAEILAQIDRSAIKRLISKLTELRNQHGRIFFLGIGGSAANASHAVNDFRKICGFEAYSPTDNVSEFSARANDDGWESVFANWLRGSRLNARDMVFVLSVGGGNLEKNVSPNLVRAVQYAKEVHATVVGIVGRDGGYTAQVADACVMIPTVSAAHVTPHAEAFQAIVWHLLVSHPALKASLTKWEAVAA